MWLRKRRQVVSNDRKWQWCMMSQWCCCEPIRRHFRQTSCFSSRIKTTFNKHYRDGGFWLVSCRSPGKGRWGRGGASGRQVKGVSSVRGVWSCVDGSVRHRSLVSWPRATVVILPVHPSTVPAHHHDNCHSPSPWQPLHLREEFISHITVTTRLLSVGQLVGCEAGKEEV